VPQGDHATVLGPVGAEVGVVDLVVHDVPVGDPESWRVAPMASGSPRRPPMWAWCAAR
jgi:hypothetical protein